MISSISPWDELDPPETDTVMINGKGACVMNTITLAKIATGEIPIKFNRLIDADTSEEIVKTVKKGRDREMMNTGMITSIVCRKSRHSY